MLKAIKLTIGLSAFSLMFLLPSKDIKAAIYYPEEGLAGISLALDTMRENNDDEEVDRVLTNLMKTKIESPYENLGVSTANEYVNIRTEPNTESKIVGKLYRGCAADILEKVDGWVKIQSGDVEGYINTDYLAIGKEAEDMIEEFATRYATVKTETLRVREKASTESKILTLIPEGEEYIVVKEYDEWVEILLGADEDNAGRDFTGFLSKDYIEMKVEFEFAISIEEENRRIAAEEAARQAEEERRQKLAEEKAKKAEEEKRRKEQEAKRAEEAKKSNNNKNNNINKTESSNNSTNSDKGNLDSKRQEVVNYALKFVGNPYVWGKTSLTNGTDCSGFTSSVYRDFGYSIARDSRSQAASSGKTISYSEAKPGDLLFYANSSGRVNHVALYIGNGRIVHAANSKQGIITSQAKYRNIYKVKRIIY